MSKATLILSLLAMFVLPAQAVISGSDDFDDNEKDAAKWGVDRFAGSGTLTELDQHLQYSSVFTANAITTYRPWALNRANYDTNWEVVFDVSNTAVAPAGAGASIGVEVFPRFNASQSVYFGFGSYSNSASLARIYESEALEDLSSDGYISSSTLGTVGAIRVTFNATTKVLSCYFDADGSVGGYTWTLLSTYGVGGAGGTDATVDWGMSGSQEFHVEIYGYSVGVAVPAGQLFIDNFTGSTSLSAGTLPATEITGTSATLNGTVYPAGADTSVVFEYALSANFAGVITTAPQNIPAGTASVPVSQPVAGLNPGAIYYARTRATSSAGTVYGNTVTVGTPPFTLGVNPTSGTVTRSPQQATYAAGTVVTLTATPPAGSAFLGWSGALTGTTNPATITMDGNKSVIANFTSSIAQAVDAPALTFTTGATGGWYGQSLVSHDGVDAARSGAIANNGTSSFQTTVTGAGTLTFWWKVSSETNDFLEFYVNNIRQTGRISGGVDWEKRTFTFNGGSNILRWQYVKDVALSAGEDAGWVDQVTWTSGQNGYANWKAQNFTSTDLANPAISGDLADPDGDGLSNYIEYALGSQPKNPSSANRPVVAIETIGEERYLTLTVTKSAAATDVSFNGRVSSDLADWFSGAVYTTIMTDNATTFKIRDNTPVSAGLPRFIRLEVSSR